MLAREVVEKCYNPLCQDMNLSASWLVECNLQMLETIGLQRPPCSAVDDPVGQALQQGFLINYFLRACFGIRIHGKGISGVF